MSRHILFEGLDGAGKTTLIESLGVHLEDSGRKVFETRSPSMNPIGALLTDHYFSRATTMFPEKSLRDMFFGPLFIADMIEHDIEIRKMLQNDLDQTWVLQSRSWLSTYCYQSGSSRIQDLVFNDVRKVLHKPDAIVFLHGDPEVLIQRIQKRPEPLKDAFETKEQLTLVRRTMQEMLRSLSNMGYLVMSIDTTNLEVIESHRQLLDFLYQERLLDAGK